MIIKPEKYVRKPFEVEAVEVTEENMSEVAIWCNGEIRDSQDDEVPLRGASQNYIKVQVKKPLSDRQTRAYVGDWVLLATTSSKETGAPGFKVYTPKAFTSSFEKQVDRMFETVQRMDERVEQEETLELGDGFAEQAQASLGKPFIEAQIG